MTVVQLEDVGVKRTLRELPASAWALLAGTFVNKCGGFLQVFMVLYLIQRGFPATQAGVALGAYGVGAIVGILVGGSVTDRFGCRRTIAGSMALAGLLTVAIPYVSSVGLILVICAIVGAAAQAYRPAASALLVAVTPQSRHVMVFAAYRLAFNLGMAAGPLLGALLAHRSYALLFWVDGATSVVFAVIAGVLLPSQRVEDATKGETASGGYRTVLRDRRYALFLLALFLNTVVYIQYLSSLPLHIDRSHLPSELFGILVSLNAVMVLIFELPITRLVHRFRPSTVVALGVGLVGVGLNLYAVLQTSAGFILATIVWSMGEIVGSPTVSAYPARVAPPGLEGRYLAAAAAPHSIGFAVGPVLGAALWSLAGTGLWWVCGGVSLMASIAALAGMRQRETTAAPPAELEVPADIEVEASVG